MGAHPDVTLRYFDARGRGQLLRYYLRARDVPFADERVPLSADFSDWLAIRDDTTRTGPFHKLPVLHWGGRTIAETLVIAGFLHRALGDEARLSAEDNLRHAMLVSALYTDLMLQLGILLWADVAFRGVDLTALTARTLERTQLQLTNIDRNLAEWQWLAAMHARPVMVADCFLWEQLEVARQVFGRHLELETYATLARFHRECPGRPAFEQLLAEQPRQISGRPGEAQAIEALHAILAVHER